MRIIIIGAGLGGIAAGIRLAAAGHSVKILEKNDQPGGWFQTVSSGRFTFNEGASVISAPFLFDELFQLAGRNFFEEFQLRMVDPLFKAFFPDGNSFTLFRESATTLLRNNWFSLKDQKAYQRFAADSEKLLDELTPHFAKSRMQTWLPFLSPKNQSAQRFAGRYFQPSLLRDLFGIWSLCMGGNPEETSCDVRAFFGGLSRWGLFEPSGGVDKLFIALTEIFSALGGRILTNAQVSEIKVFNRRANGVRLADGSIQLADCILSNADILSTAHQLIDSDRGNLFDIKALKNQQAGMSAFIYHIGFRSALRPLQDFTEHNLIFPQDYAQTLNQIFKQGVLPSDPLIYLRLPHVGYPEGCSALSVIVPVPNLDGIIDWERDGYNFRTQILSKLQSYFSLPLKANIAAEAFLDPLQIRSKYGSWMGSAFSISPDGKTIDFNRRMDKSSRIKGIYFVGSGIYPGSGCASVLFGAKRIVTQILKELV